MTAPVISVTPGLLSEAEAEALLGRAEEVGFEDLADDGYDPAYRAGRRAMWTDEALAERLFARLRPAPLVLDRARGRTIFFREGMEGTWRACGLNPRFRVTRTGDGQGFAPHEDESFHPRWPSVCGMQTLLIYLQAPTGGGATRFLDPSGAELLRVAPVAGTAVAFDPWVTHEGLPVEGPRDKVTLRTDVYYTSES